MDYRIRFHPKWLLAVLLVIVGITFGKAQCSRPTSPLTLMEVESYETEHRKAPKERDPLVRSALATGAFANEVGSFESVFRQTLKAVESDNQTAASPKVDSSVQKMKLRRLEYLQRRGIFKESELDALIDRGIQRSTQALERKDLIEDQASALLVGRCRLYLVRDLPEKALIDARLAVNSSGKSIPARLALADTLTNLKKYSEAIQQLREASFLVSNWANEPWNWSGFLSRPSRASRMATLEARKRQARAFSQQISAEVSVLRSLESFEDRAPAN